MEDIYSISCALSKGQKFLVPHLYNMISMVESLITFWVNVINLLRRDSSRVKFG